MEKKSPGDVMLHLYITEILWRHSYAGADAHKRPGAENVPGVKNIKNCQQSPCSSWLLQTPPLEPQELSSVPTLLSFFRSLCHPASSAECTLLGLAYGEFDLTLSF